MISQRVRRLARERALQFLFGLDFTGNDCEDGLAAFWEENPARLSVREYANRVIRGVCDEREDLDARILGALNQWTPDRVGRVEQNAIRIALYEMLRCDDVPPSVAINEALEVSRRFGTDESPRFVNGVLDRLRRELEEATQEG